MASSNERVTIICQMEDRVEIERVLLPRMKGVYQEIPQSAEIKLKKISARSLNKIIQWLKKYDENPLPATGFFNYSEWDKDYFVGVDWKWFIEIGTVAEDYLKIDGFLDYIVQYLIYKLGKLPEEHATGIACLCLVSRSNQTRFAFIKFMLELDV